MFGRHARLRQREREFAALNAADDLVDAAAMVVPLMRREGIDRPQAIGLPVALAVSAGWLRVLRSRRQALVYRVFDDRAAASDHRLRGRRR